MTNRSRQPLGYIKSGVVALGLIAVTVGCQGPRALQGSFIGYSAAYAEISNEQMLLNLARSANSSCTSLAWAMARALAVALLTDALAYWSWMPKARSAPSIEMREKRAADCIAVEAKSARGLAMVGIAMCP